MKIYKEYESPVGTLYLGDADGRLCLCDWRQPAEKGEWGSSPILEDAAEWFDAYFRGECRAMKILVEPEGTEFQKTVWQELMNIPYGERITYKEVARRIGRESSVRAVANAIGANKISIFIPCHRVIGANGKLTGYRGGLEAKRRLLEMELQ